MTEREKVTNKWNDKLQYMHGIIDVLRYIITEELTLEKIDEFYQKILESFNLNFETLILDLFNE